MKKIYFKVLIAHITEAILNKSTVKNPYKTQRTTDGKHILLSFEENKIPSEIFKMGYVPMNINEAKTELQTSSWPDDETTPSLINNIIPNSLPFSAKQLPDGKKIFSRVHGETHSVSTGDNTLNFSIPYPQVKFNEIEIIAAEPGDTADLKILDDSQGTYTSAPNYQLNQFGYSVKIAPDYYRRASSYGADLYYGMVISIEYNSISDKDIYINYILHEVKS